MKASQVSGFERALIPCLLFASIIIFWGFNLGLGDFSFAFDYQFHEQRALGGCLVPSKYCAQYPNGYNLLATFFSPNSFAFLVFNVLVLFVLIPILLFLVSRHWTSSWFYLSCLSFPYYFLVNGYFPQALILVLLLGMLAFRSWFSRLALLFFSLSVHFYGFVFLLIFLFLEAFPRALKTNAICVPLTPSLLKAGGIKPFLSLQWNSLISFFLKGIPFPLAVFGFMGLFREKEWSLLVLVALLLGGSVLLPEQFFRTAFMAQPLLVLGLTHYFQASAPRMQRGLLWFSLLVFAFQFLTFALSVFESHSLLCN